MTVASAGQGSPRLAFDHGAAFSRLRPRADQEDGVARGDAVAKDMARVDSEALHGQGAKNSATGGMLARCFAQAFGNADGLGPLLVKIVLIALYMGLNMALNMINKWTLSSYGFKFPITLSIAHQLFSAVALAPIMLGPWGYSLASHWETVKRQGLGLVAVAAFFSLNLGCNNLSLTSISLSLNQVIRSCIPVSAALGAAVIEKSPPSRKEWVAIIVLCSGVSMSIWEGSGTHASAMGITLALVGMVSNGLMMSSIGKLLTDKLDVWRLTWYCAPITVMLLLPFYWVLESSKLAEYRATHDTQYMGLIGMGCVLALSYNVVHSLVIKLTSALTTTVLGEAKVVMLLVSSAILLGESSIWTLKLLLGVSVAMVGFTMYSHAKLGRSREAQYLPVAKAAPDTLNEASSPNLLKAASGSSAAAGTASNPVQQARSNK